VTTTARTGEPVLSVNDLTLSYSTRGRTVRTLHSVGFDLAAGETLGLVGASGSGKSTTALAVVRMLPDNARIETGRIALRGVPIESFSEKQISALRGSTIGFIPQDPMLSLNPIQPIGRQVEESLKLHTSLDRRERRRRVVELLAESGITQPEMRVRQFPHELSGGMRQRVLIAIAIACEPALIIADEPTSALDVTVQQQILAQLAYLRERHDMAMLMITHDLAVASEQCDRIAVMDGGRIVETGPAAAILENPTATYTRELIAAAPSLSSSTLVTASTGKTPEALVVVDGLRKSYAVKGRTKETFAAVDDVSFTIPRGQTFALVGESGSGKSTTARMVMQLVQPDAGSVVFDGQDLAALRGEALRTSRRGYQLVYQNPYSSLDPRQSVQDILDEPLKIIGFGSAAERRARIAQLLDDVQLPGASATRRPAELSGGQRQRVAIARALAPSPSLIVCDEPVSALDVQVQARILELLVELQQTQGLSYLFISHDLAVVRQIAHRVGVMQSGRLVEEGTVEEIFTAPRDPYTRALLDAIPGLAPPAPTDLPSGLGAR